jgi:uncharacterized protein YqeY
MLIDTIKADSLEARKLNSREPGMHAVRANLLSTLFAEAAKVGKDAGNRPSTDEEVIAVVRKFLKNLDETIAALEKVYKDTTLQCSEKAILESYLPRQMDHAELTAAVEQIAGTLAKRSPRAMGEVMKQLKERHGGRYDGKAASEVVRAVLHSENGR